jgi:hypothetical protein
MRNDEVETVRAIGTMGIAPGDATRDLPKPRTGRRLSSLAIVYSLTLGALAIAALVSVYRDVPIGFVLRDPLATLQAHPLIGALSNVGVLVWCAAAAICFLTRTLLRQHDGTDEVRAFLFWSGLISSVLLLDDFFQFHDGLVPMYLGLSEEPIFLGYGLLTAWYLVRFRRVILASEWGVLFTALAFFALSMLVDAFQERWSSPWRILFEDGSKLLGIVSWSSYLIRTCVRAAAATPRSETLPTLSTRDARRVSAGSA